jgi:hypothetical protein
MISISLGRRAEFWIAFRQAKRSRPMMASDPSTRSRRTILFLFVLLGAPMAAHADVLADSAQELARKIAASLPAQSAVSLVVQNSSSLMPDEVAQVEQELKEELQKLGIGKPAEGFVEAMVAVTLSENFKNFVWTAEIHALDTDKVVLTVIPRPNANGNIPEAMAVTIRAEKFWEGREHILDAATMNSSDGGRLLLLLTVDGVSITRNGTDAFPKFMFPPVQTVLRNPAGTLTQAGNEVTASMPMQICAFSLDADGLSQCHPNYSTERPPPGRVFQNLQLLSQAPPASLHPEWGSQIQKIQSQCGSEAQFLVTGPGDYTQTDFVQLFGSDLTEDRPTGKPLSNQLPFPGPVMDLHADGTGARAIVRNLETGSYEAHRISIECGR